MLATLTATCCIDCLHPAQDNISDDDDVQLPRTPRHLKPENQFQSDSGSSDGAVPCGGKLTARHGIIQTPSFPNKFPVPITCVWIIDASELTTGPNVSIVIYPTQLYVLGGLRFTEYMYYGDDYKVRSQRVFQFSEHNVTKVAWIQFNSQYLEISFTMRTLDGTHLRALDQLLDVYGFNITYEVGPLKPYQCNALKCRFLGHCYAREDFSSYYCSCFPGYSGADCGQGPLCEDLLQNVCENGGTCKQIGASSVTCLCKEGYKGNKCESPEVSDDLGK
ncbi:unnamed protein product [Hermetia illucens]|uniref:Uncharacterized protein n=1 Tax=Hermetia illucens TaxID=343691 RepID=A0A7R8US55_HERIL|nr:unnamed protein product [Hermetia illucens]